MVRFVSLACTALLSLASAVSADEIKITNRRDSKVLIIIAYNWSEGSSGGFGFSTYDRMHSKYAEPGETVTFSEKKGAGFNSIILYVRDKDGNPSTNADFTVNKNNIDNDDKVTLACDKTDKNDSVKVVAKPVPGMLKMLRDGTEFPFKVIYSRVYPKPNFSANIN